MQRVKHPEWLDSHKTIKYPFADGTSLSGDAVFLPEEVFVDASLYPVGSVESLHISSIKIEQELVTITISDPAVGELCSGSFAMGSTDTVVEFSDSYGRPAGVMLAAVGGLAIFQSWPIGLHTFTTAQLQLAVTCVIPTPELGLRGILLADGTLMTGDIWLVGEDGIVLSNSEYVQRAPGLLGGNRTYKTIRVDVVGDPLFRRKLCEGLFDTPRFIQKLTVLNNDRSVECFPDSRGECKLTSGSNDAADTVLRIQPRSTGLHVEVVGKSIR